MAGARVAPEGVATRKAGGLSKALLAALIVGMVVAVVAIVTVTVVVVVVIQDDDSSEKDVYECADGTRLAGAARCDGFEHCSGGEDELGCTCGNQESACSSDGVCILDYWFCDGSSDCSQGEDEDDCGLVCGGEEYECADHSHCVNQTQRCDQTPHCDDNSDEWNCLALVERAGETVLLVLHAGDYVPVCSTDWHDSLNNDTCSQMGFGASTGSGSVAGTEVLEASEGWAEVNTGAIYINSTLDVLTRGVSCIADTAVTLNCTYDSCGTRAQSVGDLTGQERIIQGYRAEEGAWPWMVTLEYQGSHVCGGSLIDAEWVVTAAHCVDMGGVQEYTIRAGSLNVEGADTHLQTATISAIYGHEDYDEDTISNDVAVIRLATPVSYTDHVRPLCLPDPTEDWSHHVACYTTGWGSFVSTGDAYPLALQEVKMYLLDASHCQFVSIFNATIMQCSGYPDGYVSICSGDSGGPLVCRDSRNVWTLAGLSSYVVGTQSEPCQSISVFTNVPYYSDWIQNILDTS